MIRYLSCDHESAHLNLTPEEMRLLKSGMAVIITQDNTTRIEDCKIDFGKKSDTNFSIHPNKRSM